MIQDLLVTLCTYLSVCDIDKLINKDEQLSHHYLDNTGCGNEEPQTASDFDLPRQIRITNIL